MSENPLHAKWYADRAMKCIAAVSERRELAEETWLVRVDCPEMAAQMRPGQFLMVRQSVGTDPLLGRAFAVYDVVLDDNGPRYLDIVFHTVGKMTDYLSRVSPGDELVLWGPLGNGFQPAETEHLVMVAGGIGQTPFLTVAKETLGLQRYAGQSPATSQRVTLCYGARSARYHAGVDEFRSAGVDVRLATDDGSAGHHGLVTDLLKQLIAEQVEDHGAATPESSMRVLCCGPEPMMEAVSGICEASGIHCWVSLETPMACGLGICFSCVARVKQPDGSWDFKRTCVDGPVFESDCLVW